MARMRPVHRTRRSHRGRLTAQPNRHIATTRSVLSGIAVILRRAPLVIAAVIILTGSYNASTPDYHCPATPTARIHSATWQCH